MTSFATFLDQSLSFIKTHYKSFGEVDHLKISQKSFGNNRLWYNKTKALFSPEIVSFTQKITITKKFNELKCWINVIFNFIFSTVFYSTREITRSILYREVISTFQAYTESQFWMMWCTVFMRRNRRLKLGFCYGESNVVLSNNFSCRWIKFR